MNIALLTVGFDNKLREATKITILLLAKQLKKLGHRPIIISDKRGDIPEKEIIEGVEVYRLYGKSSNGEPNKILNYFIAHYKTIKKLMREGINFDIIHNFGSSPIISLRGILAKKTEKKSKLLYSIKSTPKDSKWNLLFKLLNSNDIITVQTNYTKENLIKKGVKKEKIKVINSHIDTDYFKPLRNNLKEKLKLKNKKIVFYYGPLVDRKGVKYLLLTIPSVTKKVKDVKFVFAVKPTKIKPIYEKLLNYVGISKNLILIKEHVNIVDYINIADVVVLPYPHLMATESNPSCILESMACKKPVITSNLPELRELFEDKKEILFANPKDAKDLKDKIIEILSNNKIKNNIARKGYEKSKNFNVKIITEQYLQLYNELLSNK